MSQSNLEGDDTVFPVKSLNLPVRDMVRVVKLTRDKSHLTSLLFCHNQNMSCFICACIASIEQPIVQI